MRLIMRRRVVLPQPDDPTNTVVWRDGMTTLKSSTACVPSGYSFETDLNSIIEQRQNTDAERTAGGIQHDRWAHSSRGGANRHLPY